MFHALTNLEETEENESFNIMLTIAGGLTHSAIAQFFLNKQARCNPVKMNKETGLTARAGQPRQGPKPGSPTCVHCRKAHKSKDCYLKDLEKLPQWMKDRNEERRKRHAQQQAAKLSATANTVIAEEADQDKDKEATKVAKPAEPPKMASSLASLSPVPLMTFGSQIRAPLRL